MNGQEDSRREKQAQAVAREVVEGSRVEKGQGHSWSKAIRFVIGALILVLVGMLGAVACGEAGPTPTATPAPAATATPAPAATATPTPLPLLEVSATQVLDAYSANKFNADKLYKFADNGGQLLRVTGTVISIEHEYVELSGGNWVLKDPFSNRVYGALASVYCYYDDTSIRQHINAGDYVTLIGEGGGEPDFFGEFEMWGCRLAGGG